MKKAINLLYTIIIPIIPLALHILINAIMNVSTKLENVYPELFFVTISICIESFKTLQEELKYNDTKPLFTLLISIFSISSSVAYGCILVTNNMKYNNLNSATFLISLMVLFGSIFVHIAIILNYSRSTDWSSSVKLMVLCRNYRGRYPCFP